MSSTRKSVFIRSHGPDKDALRRALAWLARLSEADITKRKVALAVDGKAQMSANTIVEVLGEAACKALAKGQPVTFGKATLSLVIQRDRLQSWTGPILAAFPSKKLLDKLDGLQGVTDIIVVPWTMEEAEFWIQAWGAEELGTTSSGRAAAPQLDPIVESALRNLTQSVNLSTGITHPSDRQAALDTFRVLSRNRIAYHPKDVRAWLVGKGGWEPKDADAVQNIAQGYLDGKRFRGGDKPYWGDGILDIWRKDATKVAGDASS